MPSTTSTTMKQETSSECYSPELTFDQSNTIEDLRQDCWLLDQILTYRLIVSQEKQRTDGTQDDHQGQYYISEFSHEERRKHDWSPAGELEFLKAKRSELMIAVYGDSEDAEADAHSDSGSIEYLQRGFSTSPQGGPSRSRDVKTPLTTPAKERKSVSLPSTPRKAAVWTPGKRGVAKGGKNKLPPWKTGKTSPVTIRSSPAKLRFRVSKAIAKKR